MSCSVVSLWGVASSAAMNPQNLLVSLLIIPHRLDRETIVHVVTNGLCWQKYCQIFFMECFLFLLITMHNINTSIEPCWNEDIILLYTKVGTLSWFIRGGDLNFRWRIRNEHWVISGYIQQRQVNINFPLYDTSVKRQVSLCVDK